MKIAIVSLSFFLMAFTNKYSYNQLDDLFNKSSQPTFKEVIGWWSGRCYKKSSPETALPFLMMASEDKNKVRHLAVVSHFDSDSLPSRYDNLTDMDRIMFSSYMLGEEYNSSEVSFILGGLYSHIGMGSQGIKKYKNFFTASLRNSDDFDYDYSCYFFKKVSPSTVW